MRRGPSTSLLAAGVLKDEIDPWSAERKARYKRSGASIATPVADDVSGS